MDKETIAIHKDEVENARKKREMTRLLKEKDNELALQLKDKELATTKQMKDAELKMALIQAAISNGKSSEKLNLANMFFNSHTK
ncbi:hypothetical protein HK100_000462 [Physocladia obscura]|uniref:Uncharacterized protein n=1 Tax=Physocladia obscura TaxID=109957 RepID=A0AAD5SYC6_9FUNG|nr:hypothetical protein HK100_000462 [Physocladia obscura]